MVESVAREMAELEDEDFYLLSGVEHGMRFSEWVKVGKITEFSRLNREEVEYRVDRTLDRGLIERNTIQYTGYKLTTKGYDALALHTFVERETLRGFGAPLGVGKESDVFEVQSYKPLALKFHREGYTNFREVMKEREYTADKEHTSWLYTARKAAEREFDILEALYPDVSVPRPIDHNRHAIVMEKMDGIELSKANIDPDNVQPLLERILTEVMNAYEMGYVHADLSEYNIFVSDSEVTVFDWPQGVSTEHNNATELLQRDVQNIIDYFDRKYPDSLPSLDPQNITAAIIDGEFKRVHE
ncbi:MAG: serine/threonine-protein kinase RIO2 [Halobacteriaceae archaeon]